MGAIAKGTNEGIVGGSHTPWTFTASDFPALKAWMNFKEATGTAITDLMGNLVGAGSNVIAQKSGSGDVWANNGVATTTSASSNEVRVRIESGDALPSDLRALGSNPIMFEIDVNTTGGDNPSAFIDWGNGNNSTIQGIRIGWNGSSNHPQIYTAGASGLGGAQQFSALTGIESAGRVHLLFVWDRSASDTLGVWTVYYNGILAELTSGVYDFVHDTDVGSIAMNSSASMGIGITASMSVTQILNAQFHNARVWYPATIPSNIATIASDMAINPDRVPDSAKALTSSI